MYTVYDTFNDRVVSRHRTIRNAEKADRKHQKAIKKYNGQNSYIPTILLDKNGDRVAWYDHEDCWN